IESDESEAPRDLRIVQQRAVLPPIRARRVQADERYALPRLLEIDPMRPPIQIEPQIPPDHRLDHRLISCRTASPRLALGPQRREKLLQKQQMPPELQHVALDPQMARADHGDKAL